MSEASLGKPGAAIEEIQLQQPGIVRQIAESRRRRTLRFRLTFIATWAILIGLLIGSLAAAVKIDIAFLNEWAPYILEGTWITIFVSVVSIGIAIVFAFFGALGRLSAHASLYGIASLYVSLVRGTPLIVQILFIYLALPQVIPQTTDIPVILLGIFALAFNYGAYLTEIFRPGSRRSRAASSRRPGHSA
jgi:His/Glu/Gln/Arg/opine family amino acid ABC transporter permease subunit